MHRKSKLDLAFDRILSIRRKLYALAGEHDHQEYYTSIASGFVRSFKNDNRNDAHAHALLTIHEALATLHGHGRSLGVYESYILNKVGMGPEMNLIIALEGWLRQVIGTVEIIELESQMDAEHFCLAFASGELEFQQESHK